MCNCNNNGTNRVVKRGLFIHEFDLVNYLFYVRNLETNLVV